jgi:aspartate kinase
MSSAEQQGLIVQKYGGSSLANAERIRAAAKRVSRTAATGRPVVVVVSAMGDTTDELIELAYKVAPRPNEREMDMLLSTGETVSATLMAMALHDLHQPAVSLTGGQAGIRSTRVFSRARITDIHPERISAELHHGKVVIVTGFQGVTDEQDITTLGRGGSDTTAVALACALSAERCDIYTDVDGIYTADPNIVPDAKKLARVAYDEMLEMASLGAKVLQARSVEFAKKYGVTVHVRSSFKPDPGTLVTKEEQGMEEVVVTGVTHDRSQAKISILRVPDRPGIAAQVFGAIAEKNVVVDMIVQNISHDGYTDMSFTLPRGDFERAVSMLKEIVRNIGAQGVVHDDRVAKVSIVGVGMRSHSGVAAKMFETLAKEGINIQMISTSEIAVSCVIEDKYAELAVRALHDAFEVGKGANR